MRAPAHNYSVLVSCWSSWYSLDNEPTQVVVPLPTRLGHCGWDVHLPADLLAPQLLFATVLGVEGHGQGIVRWWHICGMHGVLLFADL